MRAQSHTQPERFQHIGNGKYYVNFNICQTTLEIPEQPSVLVYVYDYVKVDRLLRDQIISAIIRDKYSVDQVEAIQNNFLFNDDAVEFLKLQNYRQYAKAIADNEDQQVIDGWKNNLVYCVTIPLPLTLPGGAYNTLADRINRLKVPYITDQVNNVAKCYPGWIDPADLTILQADNSVHIEQIVLFDQ